MNNCPFNNDCDRPIIRPIFCMVNQTPTPTPTLTPTPTITPTPTTTPTPTPEPITLTIGTVTTGEPGTEAAASITGTSPNFILNLTIPQGPVGPEGPQGPPGTAA